MRALVIAGYCLRVNSSANLCHLRYIDGLLQNGVQVDLLSVSERDLIVDKSIQIPNVDGLYLYDASLYDRLGSKKHTAKNEEGPISNSTTIKSKKKVSFSAAVKKILRSLYGVYGTDSGWVHRAKRFHNETRYDFVISLAYPPASHRLAEILIKKRKIKANTWIQIWEDPWYGDISGMEPTKKIKDEELRILSKADQIYYVSPLTLMYQKKMFPQYAEKMSWAPPPSYYRNDGKKGVSENLNYGYFGDYSSSTRNLRPFYDYAVKADISFTICGKANVPFKSQKNVQVYPRLSLERLKPFEEATDVLVFVCNLRGGQIPAKIYQYSATNKIVLFILDGTEEEIDVLYNYFSNFNRYIFCRNNEKSIREAINRIERKDYDESYCTALDDFLPEKIVRKILAKE